MLRRKFVIFHEEKDNICLMKYQHCAMNRFQIIDSRDESSEKIINEKQLFLQQDLNNRSFKKLPGSLEP